MEILLKIINIEKLTLIYCRENKINITVFKICICDLIVLKVQSVALVAVE